MSPTREAPTAHGTVEYETVECDSCGTEVAKDDAVRFAVGGYKRTFCGDVEFHESRTSLGWACPHCHDAGPIAFPGRDPIDRVHAWVTASEFRLVFGTIAAALLISVLLSLLVMLGVLG